VEGWGGEGKGKGGRGREGGGWGGKRKGRGRDGRGRDWLPLSEILNTPLLLGVSYTVVAGVCCSK